MFMSRLSVLSTVNCKDVDIANVSSVISLLNLLMGTKIILDDIPTCSVLDFLQTKPALAIKGKVSQKAAMRLPSWKFQVS